MGWPQKKYDFNSLADGEHHVLVRGVHFESEPLRVCKTAWQWADRHGYRLSFQRLAGGKCSLRFTPMPGREPA